MIFFFKSDGTLIKSAPETVYQGSAEAGKVYVVAPLNANMLVDVYYELPNGERWGAYLLENNGTVINNEELPDGWALWSTTLESAITQYAGTLKAQFGFYQSGTADKVPLITSQGVTITIAKGVVRDVFPDSPSPQVYEYITNAVSTILQNFKNLPNEYLSNTNEDKIALKNNGAIEYSENATAGTIAKRDSDGKINVVDGTEDLNAVNVGQLNAALANKVDSSSVSATAIKNTIAQRTITGQLKAIDGVADDDLATVKQLNAVQGNYTDITNIDLNTGDTTVEYDTELGITVNAKGTLTHKNGATEQPTTKFEVPIVGKDGIVIDKAADSEKIEVKVDTSKVFNIINIDSSTSNLKRVPYLQKGKTTLQTDISELLYVDEGNTNDIGDIPSYVNPEFGDTRSSNGVLITSDPKKPYQAANKNYVDNGFVAKTTTATQDMRVYGVRADGTQAVFATSQNVPEIDHIAQYTTGGNIRTNTPIDNLDCANKKYVDDGFVAKVDISENFVKVFTIPNGASTGTLTADVKEKLCNPDGHNYYVYDDTSQLILKYSFNSDDEIIQYKAIYLQTDKAYEITMQILSSNGSWRRSQTVLNVAASGGVTSLDGQTGALTTKTLFGNNSILGTGNIDIYKHVINFTNADGYAFFNMVVYSSKLLVVDSLTDLKTLIGDYATENVSGFVYDGASSLYYPVFKVDTEMLEVYYIHPQNGLGSVTLSDYTITDTVTTI
jgi:hypothetical protein